MAVNKRKLVDDGKLSPAEKRKETIRLQQLAEDGVRCQMCGQLKRASEFYVDTNPMFKLGVVTVCKKCARKVALRTDDDGYEHEPTKESVELACRILNKPFKEAIWTASVGETQAGNTDKRVKANVWNAYIKNVQMVNYEGMTYFDSDSFIKQKVKYEDELTVQDVVESRKGQDNYDSFEKNKADVIRLLNYDPFEMEALPDQPFLYSQLLMLLDSGGDNANEDMIRTSSAISITRNFLQKSKIDNALVLLLSNPQTIEENSTAIKSLQESKAKLSDQIQKEAAESCLSLKNSKNSIKGENTWTGKLKKIKDLNLRNSQVNGFDIATCRGMQQVQEISDSSIMKQLALDESEWSDIVANMRVTNQELRKERDQYKEINRILLQENLDLKDYLEDKELVPQKAIVDLKELYAVFAGQDEEEGEFIE